jgi:hypothetical protein
MNFVTVRMLVICFSSRLYIQRYNYKENYVRNQRKIIYSQYMYSPSAVCSPSQKLSVLCIQNSKKNRKIFVTGSIQTHTFLRIRLEKLCDVSGFLFSSLYISTVICKHFPCKQVIEYNGERTLDGLSKFLDTDGQYGQAAPDEVQQQQQHLWRQYFLLSSGL